MTALTTAENAALVSWTGSDHSHAAFMAAVREAIRITEARYDQSEDHRIAFLREELTAVKDLAFRGSNPAGAFDAIEAIFNRASKALNQDGADR